MGKGTILAEFGNAIYQIELDLNKSLLNLRITELNNRISALQNIINGLDDGERKDILKLRQTAYRKQIDLYNKYFPPDPVAYARCIDDSPGLTGEVATIEIARDLRIEVFIRPGYSDGATFNALRDGQIMPSFVDKAAGFFYNMAMEPGAQKWRPQYRTGTITSIDYPNNKCDVDVENVFSRLQNLNVNQSTKIVDADVQYMSCNAAAFEVGDRVVIEFTDRDWSKPVVIGFGQNAKACSAYIVSLSSHKSYGLQNFGESLTFTQCGCANDLHDSTISTWTNLRQVIPSTNEALIWGVTKSGSLIYAGTPNNMNLSYFYNLKQIQWNDEVLVGVRSSGTCAATGGNNSTGELDVFSWVNVVHIYNQSRRTTGVKADGTIYYTGVSDSDFDFSGWTNIVKTVSTFHNTFGLKSDGSVVWTGRTQWYIVNIGYVQTNAAQVAGWSGIIDIVCGWYHLLGLKSDGTVVAIGVNWNDVGWNFNGGGPTGPPYPDSVGGWTNIKYIGASPTGSIGAKADGTAVTAGWDYFGGLNVSSWDLF